MMTKKGKRRSVRVAAPLLAAAAVVALTTMSGCSNSDTTARCVDQNGNVLPDSACQGGTPVGNGYAGGSSGGYYGGGSGGTQPRWVYGGEGGNAVGSKATGYSTSAPSEGDISSPSGTVIRGGFGGEGGGEGGGHGGGGGE